MAGHSSSSAARSSPVLGAWGFDSTFLGLLGLAMVLLSILVWWLYYRCPQCHAEPRAREPEALLRTAARGSATSRSRRRRKRSSTRKREDENTNGPRLCQKLDLTLDILGKRDDGYHELRMVMQTVSLCDAVTVTLTDGTGVVCRVAGAELPCDERNLAVKAASRLLLRRSAITAASTSRLPSASRPRPGWRAAGADAAAVLRALRDLIAPTLTDERLEGDRRACRQRRTVLCPRRHAACRGQGRKADCSAERAEALCRGLQAGLSHLYARALSAVGPRVAD